MRKVRYKELRYNLLKIPKLVGESLSAILNQFWLMLKERCSVVVYCHTGAMQNYGAEQSSLKIQVVLSDCIDHHFSLALIKTCFQSPSCAQCQVWTSSTLRQKTARDPSISITQTFLGRHTLQRV